MTCLELRVYILRDEKGRPCIPILARVEGVFLEELWRGDPRAWCDSYQAGGIPYPVVEQLNELVGEVVKHAARAGGGEEQS